MSAFTSQGSRGIIVAIIDVSQWSCSAKQKDGEAQEPSKLMVF